MCSQQSKGAKYPQKSFNCADAFSIKITRFHAALKPIFRSLKPFQAFSSLLNLGARDFSFYMNTHSGACRGKARRAARQYGAGRRGGRGCIVPRSDAGSSGSCCLRCARPRAARARPAAAAFAQLSGDAASRCSHGRSAAACWHVRCGSDLHRAGRQNARS